MVSIGPLVHNVAKHQHNSISAHSQLLKEAKKETHPVRSPGAQSRTVSEKRRRTLYGALLTKPWKGLSSKGASAYVTIPRAYQSVSKMNVKRCPREGKSERHWTHLGPKAAPLTNVAKSGSTHFFAKRVSIKIRKKTTTTRLINHTRFHTKGHTKAAKPARLKKRTFGRCSSDTRQTAFGKRRRLTDDHQRPLTMIKHYSRGSAK